METATTKYLGDLRTEMLHVRSGSIIVTDAPVDNKGRGEKFSPTDLVASALGSCIFTIMGIAAREHGFSIEGAACSITKIMADNPRRIGEIRIIFDFPHQKYTSKQKQILQHCVKNCPVARSLNDNVIQNVILNFRSE
ncbi:MAG TPA: OsmC family protein [Bacteroidales bacterium]|nr:OsmC family protein [Bacteroidales bacterium]